MHLGTSRSFSLIWPPKHTVSIFHGFIETRTPCVHSLRNSFDHSPTGITPETAYADAAQFADKELIHISSSTRFFRIALEVELATPPRRFIASVSAASSRDWLMRLVSNDERDFDRSHATWTNSLHHTCTRREKSLHSRRIRKGNSWTSAVQVGTVVRLSSRTSWIQWNRVNAQ